MATSAQVQQLNIVYFGRPADPTGLRYWTANSATPVATIANGFATTPEFTSTIVGKSFAQIVNQFYVSLFGRSAEPAGLNYWVDLLSRGLTTVQAVGLNISNAALALPATNADNIAISSKLTAAANYTTQVDSSTAGILAFAGQPGIDAGISFLAPVLTVATIPTAAATTAAVNNLIASNSGVGQTANLSTFADIFTSTNAVRVLNGNVVETLAFRFTSDSQSVSGTEQTVQSTDQLIDPSVSDSDNLNITVTGFAQPTDPQRDAVGWDSIQTANIENFKFSLNNAVGSAFNFRASQTGVKTVTVSGTTIDGYTFGNFGNSGATSFDASGVTTAGAAGRITATAFVANLANDVITPAVTIIGGAGNDVLTAGNGADTINGGAGNDEIYGLVGNDTLNGGTGSDLINGGTGNDTINGEAGSDTLNGDAGNDTINGGDGNDDIKGGDNNDTITGGVGADSLSGGNNNDIFNYVSLTQLVLDTGNTAATSDLITDFKVNGTDTLKTGLAGTAANFRSNLNQAASYDAAKATANAAFDGAVQYAYVNYSLTLSALFIDTDANGSADASILFNVGGNPGAGLLVATDIVA